MNYNRMLKSPSARLRQGFGGQAKARGSEAAGLSAEALAQAGAYFGT